MYTKLQLKGLINEVTKDIILFGHKEPVVLFIKNGLIEDYEITKYKIAQISPKIRFIYVFQHIQ